MRLWTYYRKELLKNIWIKTDISDIVLDVGCFDWYWLSTQIAKEKHAIDIDIEPLYKNINYRKWDAIKLPYKDNFFDKVFAFDVIEHITLGKEQSFINELLRVTKKWWKIILTTPSKQIKLFPVFLTDYVSKKRWHYKCNGYTSNEILIYFNPKKNIKITHLESKWYLSLYFVLRMLWIFCKPLTRYFLEQIAKMDAKKIWKHGYLLIVVTI